MGNDVSQPSQQRRGRLTTDVYTEASTISIIGKGIEAIPPGYRDFSFITVLDLPYNRIRTLPRNIPNLESVNLSGNMLTGEEDELINTISLYSALTEVNFSRNQLKVIPTKIAKLQNIKKLNVSGNQISQIPEVFGQIRDLDISQNNFTEMPNVPPSLSVLNLSANRFNVFNKNYNSIVSLNLSLCSIESISSSLSLPHLRELDLSKNNLRSLPDLKKFIPNITKLDISDNFINIFPELPEYIKEFYYSRCECEEVPASIGKLEFLQVLVLSKNKIKNIPRLPRSIQKLNVANNCIESIEASITPKLTDVDFTNNKLKLIPILRENKISELPVSRNEITVLTTDSMANVLRADLSFNNIEAVPLPFLQNKLRKVTFAHNNITALPPLKETLLMTLNISFNPITQLPEELPDSLMDLYCSDCSLLSLPQSISNVTKLERLIASNNMISVIPKIKNLKVLNMSCNNFISFPELSSSVRSVDLSLNKITDIPESVSFPNLLEIDVSRNKLTKIPTLNAPKLTRLQVQYNPIDCSFNQSIYPKLEFINTVGTRIKFDEEPQLKIIYASKFKVKSSHCIQQSALPWLAFAEAKGNEKNMENTIIARSRIKENASLFAVFDGHLGDCTASYCVNRIQAEFIYQKECSTAEFLHNALANVSQNASEHSFPDGATCAVAIVDGNRLVASNIGNARVVLIDYKSDIRFASKVYTPTVRSEFERIRAMGGNVINNKVQGSITQSRAIGDERFIGVKPISEETEIELQETDKWLIIACNGLFSVVSDEFISSLSQRVSTAKDFACRLKNAAVSCNTQWNVSVIVVDLEKKRRPKEKSSSIPPSASFGNDGYDNDDVFMTLIDDA